MINLRRQNRTRFKLKKVTDRKRLSVFKSNNHIYAQVINDKLGITIASASSMEKNINSEKQKKQNRKELAKIVGKEIAKRSIKNGVNEVAFDKGKYKYHGIIKILADSAREAGLNF
jgi:large subunit ribosomal protein L18